MYSPAHYPNTPTNKGGVLLTTLLVAGVYLAIGTLWAVFDGTTANQEVQSLGDESVDRFALENALRKRGRNALSALKIGLDHTDYQIRLRCARLLAELGEEEGREELFRALQKGKEVSFDLNLNENEPDHLDDMEDLDDDLEPLTPTGNENTSSPESKDEIKKPTTILTADKESAMAEAFLKDLWRNQGAPPEHVRVSALSDKADEDANAPKVFLFNNEGKNLTPPLAVLTTTLKEYPRWLEGHVERASRLLQIGRVREARKAAMLILRELEPNQFEACLTAARAFAGMDRPEEALILLQRAIKINPRMEQETRSLRRILEGTVKERQRRRRIQKRRNATVA